MLKDQLMFEKLGMTAKQKSAEGIVGHTLVTEGQNKSWRVLAVEVFTNDV